MRLSIARATLSVGAVFGLLVTASGAAGVRPQDRDRSPPVRASEAGAPSDFERLEAALADLDRSRQAFEEMRARHRRELASLDAEIESLVAEVERRTEALDAVERERAVQQERVAAARAARDRQRELIDGASRILARFATWLERQLAGEPEWSHDGRRARVQDAVAMLGADPPDVAGVFRGLWTAAAETVALAGRCELGEREVDTGAETVVAATLRLGAVAMLFVTADASRAGLLTGRSGGMISRVLTPDDARETARAIDVLRRVRSPRRVELPFTLGSFVAPPAGPDLRGEKADAAESEESK